MCLPCRLRGQSQQHRGWWRVCKTSSTLCYWLCSENQEAHSRLWFRILPIYRRVVQCRDDEKKEIHIEIVNPTTIKVSNFNDVEVYTKVDDNKAICEEFKTGL